jgi:hypothetical protein
MPGYNNHYSDYSFHLTVGEERDCQFIEEDHPQYIASYNLQNDNQQVHKHRSNGYLYKKTR